MKKVFRSFLSFLIILFFLGCGYKPSSYYTKRVLGDKIYTKVYIDIKDPENSVLIKDAINEAIVSKFRAKVVDKKEMANSLLYVKFKGKSFIPTAYDKDGYVIAYRAKVLLNIVYIDRGGKKKSLDVSGTYNFSIESNSVISDTKRFEAIKFASYKAISEFVSKIAIGGMDENSKSTNNADVYLR